MDVTCKKGHGMYMVMASDVSFVCDMCVSGMAVGSQRAWCNVGACDYDVCGACYAAADDKVTVALAAAVAKSIVKKGMKLHAASLKQERGASRVPSNPVPPCLLCLLTRSSEPPYRRSRACLALSPLQLSFRRRRSPTRCCSSSRRSRG